LPRQAQLSRGWAAKHARDDYLSLAVLSDDEQTDEQIDEMIDEAVEESFPASDPPSWTLGHRDPPPSDPLPVPAPEPVKADPGT